MARKIFSPRKYNIENRESMRSAIEKVYNSIYRGNKGEKLSDSIPEIFRKRGNTVKKSNLEKYLRKQHTSFKDDTVILNLPKCPFGTHRTYNTVDSKFIDSHFIPSGNSNKDLEDITRKFRLLQRRIGKRTNKRAKTTMKSSNVRVFETRAGNLVCKRQLSIEKSYDLEKQRNANSNTPLHLRFKPHNRPTSVMNVIERLYPDTCQSPNELARKYTDKYGDLFN